VRDLDLLGIRELNCQSCQGIIDAMSTDIGGYSALLAQLDRIAKAPMTRQERELRAKSILGAGLEPAELAAATASEELPWNASKASEHGVGVQLWLRAGATVGLPASASLPELLDKMHRADAVAEMLKAGYAAGIDPLGGLTWRARG
jgi:hypothetical protein